MTRSLLIFWRVRSLALLRLFLCSLLSLLSHRLIPPFRLGYAEDAGRATAWPLPPGTQPASAGQSSRLCARFRVWPPLGGDERAVLVKRVGQFVRTAPVAA